jgi:Flp pilus assembly pilin Flp
MKRINAEILDYQSPLTKCDEKDAAQARQGGNNMRGLHEIATRIRWRMHGQTMTEYVLIIAAIAVAGYTAYLGLEGGIQAIITSVTATLTAA